MNPMMQVGGMQSGMPGQLGMMAPPQPPTKEQMAFLDKPSWEEVNALLKDHVHRAFRIDIETDSTIAGTLESDMAGLAQVLQAVGGWMKEAQPLVAAGMLPIDAAKEIAMSITRRAKMGPVVEDALDKMQPPKPQGPDPAIQIAQMKLQGDQQKAAQDQQLEQQKAIFVQQMAERDRQSEAALEQQKLAMQAQYENQRSENDMRIARAEQAYQAQQDAQQQQLEAQREQDRQAHEAQIEQMRMMMEDRMSARDKQIDLLIAQMNNATKIEVAEIGKEGGVIDDDQIAAAERAADDAGTD